MLAWGIAGLTDGKIVLERPQGGLWSGIAEQVVIATDARGVHRYGKLSWDLLRSPLLKGELVAAVRIEGASLNGTGRVSLQSNAVCIGNARFELPAAALGDLAPGLSVARFSGSISVYAQDWMCGIERLRGNATIYWRNVGTGLSTHAPLGEYRAHLVGHGSHVEIRVQTLGGLLHVGGHGRWSYRDGLSFRGTARSSAEHQSDLTELLTRLGPRQQGGFHDIVINSVR